MKTLFMRNQDFVLVSTYCFKPNKQEKRYLREQSEI